MSSTYTSRKELRTEKFTITNTIWTRHRLNTKKRVGCMNQIFKQYYNDNKDRFEQLTADDFVEYYFSKCITKKKFFQTVNKFYSCCKDAGIKITKTEKEEKEYADSVLQVAVSENEDIFDGTELRRKAQSNFLIY